MYLAVCIAFRPVGQRGESFAFGQISGFETKVFVPEVTPLISAGCYLLSTNVADWSDEEHMQSTNEPWNGATSVYSAPCKRV